MLFVPEPHNSEEELRVRADGRFGTADCFQWPQLYDEEFRYAVCILRGEDHPPPDPLSWAWYRPSRDDFEALPHAAFLVGTLKEEKAAGIASLYHIASTHYEDWKKRVFRGDKQDFASRLLKSLKHNVTLLLQHPLTFRDVIVFVGEEIGRAHV